MMTRDVHVLPTLEQLSVHAAEAVARIINSAVAAQGRCSLALAGGQTPRDLYRVLAENYRDGVRWPQVHIFWGDERLVPAVDARRNDRMAREMLLRHVPCPESQIHPMASNAMPEDVAAREYEDTMRRYFGSGRPRFDLVLLGLGAEGHTASLFPNSPALDEREHWVCAVTVPADPPARLTLTLPVFSQAANVFFLVSGAEKRRALRMALGDGTNPRACPAAGVKPIDGRTAWWVDADAAEDHTMKHTDDNDIHKGAVEGTDRDPVVPINPIGAVFEDSEVANADEQGHTSDAPRDEVETLGERNGRS
ncbi:MAG TPA: 6-phosphogluconolactonase [Vicinamibacterales bacterium]|nr:6-phosphogluconolactonase [Vicinamibacterales bacterium]